VRWFGQMIRRINIEGKKGRERPKKR